MTDRKKPVVLVICDGWGELPDSPGNAITQAKTPNFDRLRTEWPHATIEASGQAVGLPEGQIGNSEVGHLAIGTGRIIRQGLSRQQYEIASGLFYENEVLVEAIETTQTRGTNLHIIGLLSPGGVHSHWDSALALVRLAKQLGLERVYIHGFTDGRDLPPASTAGLLPAFEQELAAIGTGRIASLSGRYYAMDRDNRWDRIEIAYDVLTGQAKHPDGDAKSAVEHLSVQYAAGETDEFIRPVHIAHDGHTTHISDNDVVVYFNFRPDRARQLSQALVDPNFTGFARKKVLKNLHFVSFTEYDPALAAKIVFPKLNERHSLTEVVSLAGLKQYHVAETEKYAHVTYYLNGGAEAAFPGEDRELIPSAKVATYDLQPTMSAQAVTDALLGRLATGQDDLLVVNFANADMVGHTGVLPAAITAIETLDACLGRIAEAALTANGIMVMTADHGNAEIMIDESGTPRTAHTTSPVPVLVVGAGQAALKPHGSLSDIAPTILGLMNLSVPQDMTGHSLI